MSLLDEVMPTWHYRERHSTTVHAPPARVFAAIEQVTLAEMPLARLLMRLRGMRASAATPILEEMRVIGVEPVAEQHGRELVFGSVGQPWKLRGGARRRGADFRTFGEAGYAKMAFAFELSGDRLSTETRVQLTDDSSKRAFGRYWLVIRPFSGVIRRVWLRAIVRRAEE